MTDVITEVLGPMLLVEKPPRGRGPSILLDGHTKKRIVI
jgi:hypothetical protein